VFLKRTDLSSDNIIGHCLYGEREMGHIVERLRDLIRARQNNRILRLSFPHGDGPQCEFVVEALEASEGLSRDFEFTVEILSSNPNIQLKDIQGKLLSIELVQQGGTLRYFSGYCFSFRLKKAENIAFYEAKLGPWLKFLSLRKDCYLFHNTNLRRQTESIFGDYGVYPVWDCKIYGDDKEMTEACQFNETDGNYLHRRWESAGIYYHYEHDDKGHKLVLADDSTRAPAIEGDPEVRFHAHVGGAQEEDAISEWSAVRFVQPSSVTLRSFDFKDPSPAELNPPTLNKQGGVLNVESYEYAGTYGFKDSAHRDSVVRLRLEEMESVAKQYEATGNNSRVMPGRSFSLTDRFGRYPFRESQGGSANEFLIVEVHHVATNNYLQIAGEEPRYSNRLICSRKAIPWRPGRGFNSIDTKILAPQTAIVVGPEGQGSIYTDEYGRVRVQFHWDRTGERNERSSGWIRVSSSWAGAELGAAAVPRVGSEVIVQWLDGSPDRPIVTGCVHNQVYMPPWRLPAQRALTGLRSRELKGEGGNTAAGRSNHLILDDTHEQIQAQLKSDHQHSQLSLGHITRIENSAGRTTARGEGWELFSDSWGVARAGKGMLITTEARPAAASATKDMAETIQHLSTAQQLHMALADAAVEHEAQEAGQQADIAEVLKVQNEAIKGAGGPFPELSTPHLVLASPAGIETTTAQSTHIASANHTALTTGKDLSFSAGDSLFASVRKTFRLFVHNAGMKLIAAAGKVSIQAQSDDVEIIAKKVIALMSETDWVEIRGKKGVRLQGANHMLEISDQVQFFTSSPVLFHGNLETLAPKSISQSFNERPITRYDQEIRMLQVDDKPARHIEYELIREDGETLSGKTGASGTTEIQKGMDMERYTVRYKGELP
jgi:type VI secretion system secreted protein VgrG